MHHQVWINLFLFFKKKENRLILEILNSHVTEFILHKEFAIWEPKSHPISEMCSSIGFYFSDMAPYKHLCQIKTHTTLKRKQISEKKKKVNVYGTFYPVNILLVSCKKEWTVFIQSSEINFNENCFICFFRDLC